MHKKSAPPRFALFASLIAALGGLLFGYNTSVIAGAIVFIAQDFQLTIFQQALIVSTVLIGCIIGALSGGFLADYLGRKKALFLTLLIFFLGILCLTEAFGFTSLMIGRFISGLAIGIVSVVSPLYIAEISPTESRGAFVSINQLLITIGILLAYIVSYYYADKQVWRLMFAFAFIPCILQFIGLFFIPETPSWLISHGKNTAGEKVLDKLGLKHTAQQISEIHREEKKAAPKASFYKDLLASSMRKPFFVGMGVSILQQITGINIVIYYAPKIFQLAGYYAAQTAIFATLLVGCVNVVFTILSLWLIDWVGRKPLLLVGLIGMGASLAVLGFSFFGNSVNLGLDAIISLMFYVAFFATTLGPVAWVIISEVFPITIRGGAMGLSIFANWLFNYLISLTFLPMIESFGTGFTFWFYAIICIFGLGFAYKWVPETKGKTFEEIQSFWRK